MLTSKRGRSVLRVDGSLVQTGVLAVCACSGLLVLSAAAADLATAKKSAQGQTSVAKRRQAAETELQRLAKEAEQLEGAGKLPEAIAVSEKAARMARGLYGNESEPVAAQQESLADLHETREEWQAARQARQDVLAKRTKLYGERDWRVTNARLALEQTIHLSQLEAAQRRELAQAASLNQEVDGLQARGEYGKATQLAEKAVAINKKILGETDSDYAVCLNVLAALYVDQGENPRAEPLYRQALAIQGKVVGKAHPKYATCLNNLALLYRSEGDFAKAEPFYWQASEIWKNALGETSSTYAASLNNLAQLYRYQGDYAKAEPLLRQALEIKKKALGEADPDYATSLNNLAMLYQSQGDYAKAEPMCRQALAIRKKALGERHLDYATSLNDLAGLYRVQGGYAKAEPLYRESQEIRKTVLGEAHPHYAQSLDSLAMLYQFQGNYAKAEPLSRQALLVFEKNFANAFRIQSERQQLAMASFLRAALDDYLYVTETAGGTVGAAEVYRHVLSWKGLVFSMQAMTRRARANPELDPLFDRFLSVSTRLAKLSLAVTDSKQREDWLPEISDLTNRREDLERDLARKSAEFRQAQESACLTPEQLQRVLPKGAALVDCFEFTGFSRSETKGRYRHERRLAAFVVRVDHPIVRVDLGPIQPLVNAADNWRQSILGDREERSTASPARPPNGANSSTSPDHLLRERLWVPLRPYFQGIDLVMISPDGFLNQIPLAALPGQKPGTYLLEEVQLVTVPVPRELPALLKAGDGTASSSNPSLLLVGNVDFDGDPGLMSIAQRDRSPAANHHRSPVRDSGSSVFAPLPGTSVEIDDVQQLFRATFPGKEFKAFQKSAATEDAFRVEAPRHRWIHLATHGFFAPESVPSGVDHSTGDKRRLHGELFGSANAVRDFHPELLSGIALSGANGAFRPQVGFNSTSGKDTGEGVLTALEVAGLDLRNVDLVVLSACETGLGRIASGEGVLGLQRAFQLAGAKNVMASLWKVDDQATVALMRVFYHKLWVERKPAAVALREAQLAVLRHPDRIESLATTRGPNFNKTVKVVDSCRRTPTSQAGSPRLWAAFVISGTGM